MAGVGDIKSVYSKGALSQYQNEGLGYQVADVAYTPT